MFGLKPTDIEYIINILSKHPEVEIALMYGSRAMGNYKPGSDVDLALKGKYMTDSIALNIAVELNEHSPLPYMFDVVSFPSLTNQALIEHINHHGKSVYTQTTR